MVRRLLRATPLALFLSLLATSAFAQSEPSAELAYAINNITLFICATLVLFMQAGFALVEVGFNSSKNVVNIMFKNLVDMCVGVLIFWTIGYGIMYGSDVIPGVLAWGGIGISETAEGISGLNPQLDFLFQVAFAATAATIVSGAVGRAHQV